MAEDKLFSGESKNIEYKVTVPEKSEKYMKTVVAFANGRGGRIYAEGTDLEGQNRYLIVRYARICLFPTARSRNFAKV